MILQFSKKEILILISGLFFVLILYFTISFAYLNPLKENVLQKENSSQLKNNYRLPTKSG